MTEGSGDGANGKTGICWEIQQTLLQISSWLGQVSITETEVKCQEFVSLGSLGDELSHHKST